MTDQKTAYASRSFKKDKNAWVCLILIVLFIFWGRERWGETDRIKLDSWKGPISNQATLTVLEFDRVVLQKTKDHIYQEDLRRQLKALEEDGFEAVSLTDIIKFYYEGKNLPEKSVLLIFANGYLETYTAVDPILRQMKWPAAMTIITETVVKRETFFLYWDRLRRMVDSGVWSLASGGHRRRGAVASAKNNAPDGILSKKLRLVGGGRNENDQGFLEKILADYKVSRDLVEENIPGYIMRAYSPLFDNANNHIKNISQVKLQERGLRKLYQLRFVNSFVGINDKNSDPLRLRRLRVKPGWKPETLLTLVNQGIRVVTVDEAKTTQAESLWFREDGELVDTSTHRKNYPRQNIRLAGMPNSEQGIRLYGVPGAGIFFPAGNRVSNWVLEADIRLDHGEFWIRQNSYETGDGWRVGGNSETINVQVRVANGQYENLASSQAGIDFGIWQHVRLIKRGKGIIVNLNGVPLWNLPLFLRMN